MCVLRRYSPRVEEHIFSIDTWRLMVPIQEFDLVVGDVLQVGDATVTVIDIDDGEVTFRVDNIDSLQEDGTSGFGEDPSSPLPR